MCGAHCGRAARTAMLWALMRPVERAARVLLLAAWMGLITYWSGQGSLPIDQPIVENVLHGYQHRVAHLVAFGVVGLLAGWAFSGSRRAAVWAVLLTSAFGAADEWHQSFTAGRRPAIDDCAMDTASAALAVYAWSHLRTTRWQVYLRPLAPVALGAVFVVGVGLALLPTVPLPADVNRAALRSMTTDVAHGAIQFARSTRNAARQFRSTVAG
jgi:hypothetical protein